MTRSIVLQKGQRTPLDAAALGRLRRAYTDGVSEDALLKRFKCSRPVFLAAIEGLKRPLSEGLKPRAPTGLARLL